MRKRVICRLPRVTGRFGMGFACRKGKRPLEPYFESMNSAELLVAGASMDDICKLDVTLEAHTMVSRKESPAWREAGLEIRTAP